MSRSKSESHQATKPADAGVPGSNISELSRLTGVDRAQLRRICADVKPIRMDGAQKFYLLSDIQAVMSHKPSKSLKDELAMEMIRKHRIANDKAESKLILKTDVAAAIRRSLGSVSSILESKIVAEWPSAVAGLDPAQARVYGRRLYDDVMAQCQALEKEFPA